MARRRAVRLTCGLVGGPDWRKAWLKRFWLYHGHLARSTVDHPMTRILRVCSSTNLRRGLRPRWIADLSVRKLQKVFSRLECAEQYVCWEEAAQDRDIWIGLLDAWWEYWLPPDKEPVLSLDYLMQRQIVLVRGPKEAHGMYLRPPRDVLEEPYTSPLLDIREYTGEKEGNGMVVVVSAQLLCCPATVRLLSDRSVLCAC